MVGCPSPVQSLQLFAGAQSPGFRPGQTPVYNNMDAKHSMTICQPQVRAAHRLHPGSRSH